jgi:hypothetical protein
MTVYLPLQVTRPVGGLVESRAIALISDSDCNFPRDCTKVQYGILSIPKWFVTSCKSAAGVKKTEEASRTFVAKTDPNLRLLYEHDRLFVSDVRLGVGIAEGTDR